MRTKITFSSLAKPFALTYTDVATFGGEISVVVRSFLTHCFHCGQDCAQERTQARVRWKLPPVVPWKTFRDSYSALPRVTSEQKGISNKGLGGKELNQFGMPSGLPLVHLHSTSVAEPGGMSKAPALVSNRPSPTTARNLRWKVCLHHI